MSNKTSSKKNLPENNSQAFNSDLAETVNLKYINSGREGYSRSVSGKKFFYTDGSNKIKDKKILDRILKLKIPPAWQNVWICKFPNGHLQATGTDKMGRKQYLYHTEWNLARNRTKFYRLYEFGRQLPLIRREIRKNLSVPGYSREKIISALISILERTKIRIGNSFYEKLYGSFGLTTLKNRHVKINGASIRFSFIGKKGVSHKIELKSRRLAKIIKRCKEIPGKELFSFIDENGNIHSIDSGMVNNYIHQITGCDFTAKDFRTWAGSVSALSALSEIDTSGKENDVKKKLQLMFEHVAMELGNTTAVCKKYYVHPLITDLYEKNLLCKYLSDYKSTVINEDKTDLYPEERILMKILKARL